MPGPIVKKADTFRKAVPKPLQGLYDYFADDPMGGLSPAASVTTGPTKGLLGAIRGLQRSIPKGKEVAEEMMEALQIAKEADIYGQRAALFHRVTPRNPPPPTSIKLPEFAKDYVEEATRKPHYMKRAPAIEEERRKVLDYWRDTGYSNRNRGITKRPTKMPLMRKIESEMRRGIETPAVRSMEDLALIAKPSGEATIPARKPLLRNVRKRGGPRKSVTEAAIRAIRKAYDDGASIKDIAKEYPNLSSDKIKDVATRMVYPRIK